MTCIRCGEPSERAWCSTCVARHCCSQHRTCVHRPPRNTFARRSLAIAALLMASCAPSGGGVEGASVGASSVPGRTRLAAEAEAVTTTTVPPRPSTTVRASRGSRRPAVVTPAPRPAPAPSGDFWWRLALCESGGRQDAVGGGGRYLSYFQWALSTWRAAGGTGDPRNVDYATQRAIAQRWAARTNPYRQWPVCWPRAVG